MRKKLCRDCDKKKPADQFYSCKRKKDGLQTYCKPCYNTRMKVSYNLHRKKRIHQMVEANRTRTKYIQSLKHMRPCADCKVPYPHYVMDFDHVRGKKKFNLSIACQRSNKAVLEELAKCDIVCANCHRLRTHRRGKWQQVPPTGLRLVASTNGKRLT